MIFSVKILLRREMFYLIRCFEAIYFGFNKPKYYFSIAQKISLFYQFDIQELKLFSEYFSAVFSRCFVFPFSD